MMQEYDDDFFFEEDKIRTARKDKNKLLLSMDDSAPMDVQCSNSGNTDKKLDDIEESAIADNENSTDCVFNDLRQERYLIQHQELMQVATQYSD